jgi:hypothetical protein
MLNDPQKIIFDSTQEINLFMGGTGSGKTFLDGIISGYYIKYFSDVYGFIGANTYEQLNTSSLKRIRDTWQSEHGWRDGIDYVIGKQPPRNFDLRNHNFDRYDSIISFSNGAVVYKGSLDNYEVHSGKQFGWSILDETWMTKEEAVKDVILTRLRQSGIKRGGKDLCPIYISTTPAKVEWINNWFHLDEFEQEINSIIYDPAKFFQKTYDNKCVIICSIYHNAKNLPSNYIPNLIKEYTDRNGKLKESGKRLIFANPFVRAGGEFYSSFDRLRHTTDVPYIDGLPLHISFDFNVVPYITLLVWQVQRKDGILYLRQIDEFCLKGPLNKTEKLCQEFERHYSIKAKHGLFYYGDATGKNQDTRGLNDYQIVERTLRLYLNNFSKRVPYRNPSVSARRQFINNILDEKYNIRILIDRKCKETIRDMEFVKEDATGHKLKERVKDELTGQSYESLGHTSDASDYFYVNCEILKDIFNKEFK